MAVGIREFSTPNFAQHIPGEDKEERPIQKIEKFATFLNELPWFPKGTFDGLGDKIKSLMFDSKSEGDGTKLEESAPTTTEIMVTGADPQKMAADEVARQNGDIIPVGSSIELQMMKDTAGTDDFAKALGAAMSSRNLNWADSFNSEAPSISDGIASVTAPLSQRKVDHFDKIARGQLLKKQLANK